MGINKARIDPAEYDSWEESEEENQREIDRKEPFFASRGTSWFDIGCGRSMSFQKKGLLKEKINEIITRNTLESYGYEVVRLVMLIENPPSSKREISPWVLDRAKKLPVENQKALFPILEEIDGLPDLVAFKGNDVLFVELKSTNPAYRDLRPNQEQRRKQILDAGFQFITWRRWVEIGIKLVDEESEGDSETVSTPLFASLSSYGE